jgi:hypothetical protein
MRIIIVLLVVVFLYILLKPLLIKNKMKTTTKKRVDIKYCKHCKSYVTSDDFCGLENNNYKYCKNYKWD